MDEREQNAINNPQVKRYATHTERAVICEVRIERPASQTQSTRESKPVRTSAVVTGKVMGERDIAAVAKRQKIGKVFVQAGIYLFLTVVAVTVLFPFYWMLISSFKSMAEYNLYTPTLWPKQFVWGNYIFAFTSDLHLGRLFFNTCYVGIVSTILSLIITVLSAYAFAKFEFRGKNALFAALLATMMIPGELFTVTNFITVSKISIGNFKFTESYAVLIVPFLVSVFYIYLLRQNFMQIPNELYLAAKVDGTSDFKYLWKVMIPLSAPTLISITILKMMGSWNSYIWPSLVTNEDHWLVTVGLRNSNVFTVGQNMINYPAQMATVMLVTLPLLFVFMFFRKYIMRGVSRSGIKG